jgi:hypothetical protein
VGKGFASTSARVNLLNSVIANVDTGGEFSSSVIQVKNTWLMNIPDGEQDFVDDDNDGFYFSAVHSSGEASRFEDSFIINTKDDGIDHNGARLEIVRAWVQGAFHEGLASSNDQWANVSDSVFIGNNQGLEAGYGSPALTASRSVVVGNRHQVDPRFPITAGLRFGDGYDGSNGDYTGHITASYLVLADNGDNVRNYDGTIPGPQPGAIEVTSSLANDADANDPSNLAGVPVFGPEMHLLRGSAGFTAGPDGLPVGRMLPPTVLTFVVPSGASGDFNADGSVDEMDLNLFCAALAGGNPSPAFDLTGDGVVDADDRDDLVQNQLRSTYGDANLDRVFNSTDLVEVFARGQYEDGVAGNSSWADGDWNCDGEFDTQDIVLAFQTGGYVAAAVDQAVSGLDWGDVASALGTQATRRVPRSGAV